MHASLSQGADVSGFKTGDQIVMCSLAKASGMSYCSFPGGFLQVMDRKKTGQCEKPTPGISNFVHKL